MIKEEVLEKYCYQEPDSPKFRRVKMEGVFIDSRERGSYGHRIHKVDKQASFWHDESPGQPLPGSSRNWIVL
jgi:hypothetical protein